MDNNNTNWRYLIAIALAVLVISGLSVSISAQPPPPPDVVILTDPIRLTADPASVTADGSATATITADVVWPEGYDILTGTPACLVNVSFYTTLGDISPYNITMPTPDNQSCIAVATLTAGTEPGTATITAMADIAPPDMPNVLVRNTTTVTFFAPGATPTPTPGGGNGGGNGGDGGDGGGTTTPTPTASPTATVSPGATVTPSPEATPTGSPTVTGTPTPTGAISPTPTAPSTATPGPTKKPLIPGFEAAFAIAGLLAVAYLVMQRRNG